MKGQNQFYYKMLSFPFLNNIKDSVGWALILYKMQYLSLQIQLRWPLKAPVIRLKMYLCRYHSFRMGPY